MTWVALLRGINVGGKNLVPMKALAQLFTEAGCRDVRTYIQSGNVLFEAAPDARQKLAGRLSTTIEKQFGFRVPVILRTRDELAAVLANKPLSDLSAEDTPEEMLHVYFLAEPPTPEKVSQLDNARSLPDAFVVQGCEVFLRLPNGMARTKLTNAYFDAKLGTTATARNWRTIQKLLELMSR